jgi:hypothetical protein
VISKGCGRKNLEFCFLEIPSTSVIFHCPAGAPSDFVTFRMKRTPGKHATEKQKCPEISLKQKFDAGCRCGHARNRQSRTEPAALADLPAVSPPSRRDGTGAKAATPEPPAQRPRFIALAERKLGRSPRRGKHGPSQGRGRSGMIGDRVSCHRNPGRHLEPSPNTFPKFAAEWPPRRNRSLGAHGPERTGVWARRG